jgi:phosphoribosylaminoimidazolecarboxamide formyltransferase/IMP cyclohydrolase
LLKEAGITVHDVSDVTHFPEMLDGRVKTIHPNIAGGILAIRSKEEHMEALEQHAIPTIDLVVVNLYAFEKIAAKPDAHLEEIVENIDIGGPTMIRAAAKNWQDVAVVTGPEDYGSLLDELRANGGALSRKTHWDLAVKAFHRTAAYDRAISNRLADITVEGDTVTDQPSALPRALDLRVPRALDMRYGENPHQKAALYAQAGAGVAGGRQLQGKELSYNNLVDLDAAWLLVQEFTGPASVIIKHTNPCGCAEQATLAESYRKAFEADPVSAERRRRKWRRPLLRQSPRPGSRRRRSRSWRRRRTCGCWKCARQRTLMWSSPSTAASWCRQPTAPGSTARRRKL